MGAYEYFVSLPSVTLTGIPFTWLILHGLSTDGSADNQDPDHDGMTTFEEWVAGTDPTNAASGLKLTGLSAPAGAGSMVIQWQSVDARTYVVSRSSNLVGAVWSVLATNLPATPPLNTYTDTTAVARPSAFYRIAVMAP